MSLPGAQEQPAAVGQQPHFARVVERLRQPAAKVRTQRVHELFQIRRREPAAPQVGENDELDEIDRRVPALRKSAGARPPGRNRGRKDAARVPALQLFCAETRQGGDLACAVAGLELHVRSRRLTP